MRLILVTLLLSACATSPDTEGTGTATPPVDNFEKVGAQIDKADARVAAAVTVARENADKPEVVKSETGVALSYIAPPTLEALTYARNRVARQASAEEYKLAEDAGRKLLAVIDDNWNKAEQDAIKNKAALAAANKQIAALKTEVEQVRTEGLRNAFAVAAGICFLAALAMALLGQYIRAAVAFTVGAGVGGLPYLFASPYFLPSAGGLMLLIVLLIWLHLRKPACPDAETPPQS